MQGVSPAAAGVALLDLAQQVKPERVIWRGGEHGYFWIEKAHGMQISFLKPVLCLVGDWGECNPAGWVQPICRSCRRLQAATCSRQPEGSD